jgi:hypothetical protein
MFHKRFKYKRNNKNKISQPIGHQITSDLKLSVPVNLMKNVPPVRKHIEDFIQNYTQKSFEQKHGGRVIQQHFTSLKLYRKPITPY